MLRADGYDAYGVRDRGLLEATDPEVFARAFAEDRIVVTVNVADFEALAASCELHAGVVLVKRGDLLRHEQIEVVRQAVAAIVERGDLVNTVLRVELDGTMSFEPLPTRR